MDGVYSMDPLDDGRRESSLANADSDRKATPSNTDLLESDLRSLKATKKILESMPDTILDGWIDRNIKYIEELQQWRMFRQEVERNLQFQKERRKQREKEKSPDYDFKKCDDLIDILQWILDKGAQK